MPINTDPRFIGRAWIAPGPIVAGQLEHVDPGPSHATRAYWIRATQEDDAQAWTSPVYLDPR